MIYNCIENFHLHLHALAKLVISQVNEELAFLFTKFETLKGFYTRISVRVHRYNTVHICTLLLSVVFVLREMFLQINNIHTVDSFYNLLLLKIDVNYYTV